MKLITTGFGWETITEMPRIHFLCTMVIISQQLTKTMMKLHLAVPVHHLMVEDGGFIGNIEPEDKIKNGLIKSECFQSIQSFFISLNIILFLAALSQI